MNLMKRLIGPGVFLLLVGCAEIRQSQSMKLPENPRWVKIATSTDGNELGVDSSSINRTGSLVTFFQKTKASQPDENGASIYVSWRVVDCGTQLGKMMTFTEVNSEGVILSSERSQEPGMGTKSPAGSVGAAVDEYVCSGTAPGNIAQEPLSGEAGHQVPINPNDEVLQRELVLREQQHRHNLELQGQRLRAEQSSQIFMQQQKMLAETSFANLLRSDNYDHHPPAPPLQPAQPVQRLQPYSCTIRDRGHETRVNCH